MNVDRHRADNGAAERRYVKECVFLADTSLFLLDCPEWAAGLGCEVDLMDGKEPLLFEFVPIWVKWKECQL